MLPLLYHTHHSSQAEDLPFWLALAQEQGSPTLELGCGSGRVYWHLAQAGFALVGLDLDAGMLAFLQAHPPAVDLPGETMVFQADMASYHLSHPFPLILLPCNTLSALPRPVRQAMLEQTARHLAPGGVFAASLPNPEVLLALPAEAEAEVEDSFLLPGREEAVQVSSAWQRDQGGFQLWWYYDLLFPDGQVKRFSMEVSHSLDQIDVYLGDLASAGLEVFNLYGDYDRSPYTAESPYLIFLARRGAHF